MDRVELGIKLDQINRLREKGEYADAAKVCDTIDWRRVKKWSELSVAQEVYEKAGRMKDSRNICVYAYNRSLGGKRLLFKLTELSIAINDLEEADDLYKEFVENAPRDMERYILLYKLNKARGAGNNKLIDILEEYKQNELDEQYEYELAELYADAGRIDDCVRECDDLILWFNEGEYVEKALRLKAKHAELTKAQKAKLKTMEESRASGLEHESALSAYESEPDRTEPSAAPSAEYTGVGKIYDEEYRIPEKDYSIYDTQNVQAELAKNMAAILEGIKRADRAAAESLQTTKERTPDISEELVRTEPVDMEDYYGRTAEIYSNSQELYDAAQQPAPYAQEPEPEMPEEPLNDGQAAFAESPDSEAPYKPEQTGSEEPYGGFDDMPVDEPTKEIRINTHHWKRYKSYMVEDENSEAANPQPEENGGALTGCFVEKAENEAEPATEAESITDDLETAVEAGADEEAVTETLEAEEPEAAEEETAEEPINEERAGKGAEPQPDDVKEPEEDKPVAEKPSAVPAEAPDNAEDSEIIDGQIDLLAWLSADSEISEAEEETETKSETEEETAAEAEAEVEPEQEIKAETEPESEGEAEPEPNQEQNAAEENESEDILPDIEEPVSETEEDKSVEEVMDEMTRMLMAEVTQDIEEREKQKKPTKISEEEYIATSETENEDKEELRETEEQAEEADAESAVTGEAAEEEPYGAEAESYKDNPYDEDNDFLLKAEERKYLRQYLFMDGLEAQAAQIINSKKREVPDGTSSRGNIVILGKSKTNKKNFAIDLFKAMHAQDGAGSLKIARTTAAIINRNGIKPSADKIKGMTLIVEHAGQLTKKSISEMCGFMKGDTESMLVMLTGEDYAVKRVFNENPDFAEMFDYTVHIRQYTVNEFVAMAKEYSRVKGYLITDRALLKLYLMIDGLVAKDEGAQLDGVRRIVDNAIERSRKKPKKSGALIRLKEKDFVE